jgi:integrase
VAKNEKPFTTCSLRPCSPSYLRVRTATSTRRCSPASRDRTCARRSPAPARATGTPHFSPHGLRKRRGSLLSKQGYSLAEIAERLGDTKVVTAEHYLFALGDYAEVDYRAALVR